jgi:ADP-glucose pyrophosphorylase
MGDAQVHLTAYVSADSVVSETAVVHAHAGIIDASVVTGNSVIGEQSQIESSIINNTKVGKYVSISKFRMENSVIGDSQTVRGACEGYGNIPSLEDSQIVENADVQDIYPGSRITGSKIFGDASIRGNVRISKSIIGGTTYIRCETAGKTEINNSYINQEAAMIVTGGTIYSSVLSGRSLVTGNDITVNKCTLDGNVIIKGNGTIVKGVKLSTGIYEDCVVDKAFLEKENPLSIDSEMMTEVDPDAEDPII